MGNVQFCIRYVRSATWIRSPLSRRLLLGRLGSGTGIVGTFLLPSRLRTALAATGSAPSQSAAMTRPQLVPRPPPPLVMLDPGHGGKDPGAIGISGTYEKQVALATAFELKRQLEAERPLPGRADPHTRRVHSAGRPGGAWPRRTARRCSSRCMPMHFPITRCVAPASIPLPIPLPTRRPRLWRGARTALTVLPAGALQRLARGRPHPGQPGAAGDPGRLRRARSHHGRQSRPGSADAAEPRAPRRLRRAEGGGHPQRAGGDGLHVQSRAMRRNCDARAIAYWSPRRCGARSMPISPPPAHTADDWSRGKWMIWLAFSPLVGRAEMAHIARS